MSVKVKTVSNLTGRSRPYVMKWVRDHSVFGTVTPSARFGGRDSYSCDEVAWFLKESGDHLRAYAAGKLSDVEVQNIKGAIGTGPGVGESPMSKVPLLIEMSRPNVPAELRAKILAEAVARNMTVVEILIEAYADQARAAALVGADR